MLDDDREHDTIPVEGFNLSYDREPLDSGFVDDQIESALIRTGQHLPVATHRSHPAVHIPDYASASLNVLPGQQMVTNTALPPDIVARLHQQQAPRPSKGVTFDGRTSAPVYERRKKETRDKYLRTNSEEYGGAHVETGGEPMIRKDDRRQVRDRQPLDQQHSGADESEDNEERSSSIASRNSNASFAGSTDQHQHQSRQRSHRTQRSAITASEFNITTGQSTAPDTWLAGQQQVGPKVASSANVMSKDSRIGRGPEFPVVQVAPEQVAFSERHGADRGTTKHPRQHSSSYLEGGSVSDTGGTASISDKEASISQTIAMGGSAGTPPGSRSERRARVRDNQQSSNERSIGDGAGSSQSLKSQGGIGTGSGGLSKKSNSTTQLSLSGKLFASTAVR